MENRKRRALAIDKGQHCYSKEVIELWPTCVVCDSLIRGHVNKAGMNTVYRQCNCPGKLWRPVNSSIGWEVVPV